MGISSVDEKNKLAIQAASKANMYIRFIRRVEHQYMNNRTGITSGLTKISKSLSLKNSKITATIDRNKYPMATEFTNRLFLKKELVDFDLILYVILTV
jgi:hypothetical protein